MNIGRKLADVGLLAVHDPIYDMLVSVRASDIGEEAVTTMTGDGGTRRFRRVTAQW